MTALAAALALALSAGPACRLPPLAAGGPPWRTGEALRFDLDLLGMVRAGALDVSVERPISGGRLTTLRARARTVDGAASVRRLAGVALSWVDATTLLPERYTEEWLEDGVRRSTDVRFVPGAPQVTLAQTAGDRKGTRAFPREGAALDGVSALYRLRASVLAPGEPFCFDLVATGRYWHVQGRVAARQEKVETPAGTFETLRLDMTARRADDPRATRSVHLWISTDARRLPVAAVSEIDLGPVSAKLASVRGARAP